ncbi:MAG: DegT/DnrJ/EryC1/StrS family aminotransferase [Pseudomonadales bacterium]|nr:DegT/DnrJ/EryC1/StrS family aminotransferase [Pseudomonadales bacterium]
MPPLEDLVPYLERIWASGVLTNRGALHDELENHLRERLDVDHLSLVSNATLGLMLALRQLGLGGEVITTPFSFVATSHALLWAGLTPVFVDIDPETFNLDPDLIEDAITDRTSAILPVHCFGRACDIEAIDRIAERYGLRVLYDAAHCFDVRVGERGILRAGDLSVVSFHATKVFNTFEGGAIACGDAATKAQIDRLANFGITSEGHVTGLGLNAKLNEASCAMGLASLPHLDEALCRRRQVSARYRSLLSDCRGIRIPEPPSGQTENHSYFPIEVLDSHTLDRDSLLCLLRAHGVHARRYFYPLLPDLEIMQEHASRWRGETPRARELASRILCLPIHPGMEDRDVERVAWLVSA